MSRSVCFIGNYQHFSGALEVFRNLAIYAKLQGWTTAYIFHAAREGDLIPDMSMFDEVLPMIHPSGGDSAPFAEDLAKLANRFDIVHTSLIPQDWRYLFKNHVTRPMVETYHSPDGWKWCWKQYRWRIKGKAEKPADATVAVSAGLGRAIAADLGVEVHTIPNGVRIPPVASFGGEYVTYCGRIAHDKGLDEWMNVAAKVRELRPQTKFQWVGELSPHYDPMMFRWLQAGCPWLEFVGFHKDVSKYYQRSRCTLLTSPSEGLPMSILESMAHGVPSIAYDVGDIKETKCHLITPGDVDAAAALVLYLFKPYGHNMANAEAMREGTRLNFGMEAMGREYLELYESLLLPVAA